MVVGLFQEIPEQRIRHADLVRTKGSQGPGALGRYEMGQMHTLLLFP